MEIAIAVPFEASEVKEIILQELKKRLDGLSPLSHSKEYAAFSVDFQVKILLRRTGETVMDSKETLAWGKVEQGGLLALDSLDAVAEGYPQPNTVTVSHGSTFESKDPNEERQDRDLPLTVETGDGRGGKIRKKIKVRQ